MTRKIKDIVATVGTYEQNGQTKKRFQTVGSLMESNDGGQFIMLNRSFNPAGVAFKEGSESILLSLYDPKPNGQIAPQQVQKPQPVEDDIAF